MKRTLGFLGMVLMAGGALFAQPRVSIGVGVGGYGPAADPPPAYAQYQPPCPGPGYTWVDGYYAFEGGRNVWVAGFWRAPVVTIAPRYDTLRGYDRDDHDRDRVRVDMDRDHRAGDRRDDHGRR